MLVHRIQYELHGLILLDERRCTEEQQRLDAKVEVAIAVQRLLVSLVSVLGHGSAVKVSICNCRHLLVQGLVEAVVVTMFCRKINGQHEVPT